MCHARVWCAASCCMASTAVCLDACRLTTGPAVLACNALICMQIMSTEDVQDQHCAAFDAAMDCVQALLHDELQAEPVGAIRIILPHGQVGAVMGKKGATIK